MTPAEADALAERTLHRLADEHARRLGVSRRAFLAGPCGTAAALWVINLLSGCRAYKVTRRETLDAGAAREVLSGKEFILDAQTHHIDATPGAVWPMNNLGYATMFERISRARQCGTGERFGCLSREAYIRELFTRSDTTVALLAGVPGLIGKNPLDNDELAETRKQVNDLAKSQRLLTEGLVHPNVGPGELEAMRKLAERGRVVGWTVYTGWAPGTGGGWWLDDPKIGPPFFEKARKLERPIVFAHKGLPWPDFEKRFCSPRDIGPVAKQFPDIQFVVYHSGYETDVREGPYDPFGSTQTVDVGVNRLIKSLEDEGVWPNQNVYAELGGAWQLVMTRPLEAAHLLGKLLKHVGEDRVLWGTDALFLGSPQTQIEAFRAFQIPEELQEKFGYPALTPQIKAKILGLNAAALLKVDPNATRNRITAADLDRDKQSRLDGPVDRRGLLGLRRSRGARAG